MLRFSFVVLWIVGGLHVSVLPTVVPAQAAPDTGRACFVAKPLPECRTFWITEVGYYRRAFGPGDAQPTSPPADRRPDLDSHGSVELGLMSNRSPQTAVGGTAFLGIGGSTFRFGLKARYRRWIPDRKSVEVSAGPLRVATRSPYSQLRSSGFGITGDVALGWRDWVAVNARGDLVRGGGHNTGAMYGGIRLGSYPAIIAITGIAAYIGILFALIGGEGT